MAQAVPYIAQAAKTGNELYTGLVSGRSGYKSYMSTADQKDIAAQDAVIAASRNEDIMRSEARNTIGTQLVGGADSGITLSGSRLDMLRQSYRNEEADAAHLRNEGLTVYHANKQQAAQSRQQAKNILRASKINAWKTGLEGVSSMVGTYRAGADARTKKAEQQELADKALANARQNGSSRMLNTLTYSGTSRNNSYGLGKILNNSKYSSSIKTPKIF